jgi:DNA-binding NarL/FixJ family response regulator
MREPSRFGSPWQMTMRILIAGHYPLLRDGLSLLVNEVAKDAQTVQAASYEDILRVHGREKLDLALIDSDLPGLEGTAAIDLIHRLSCSVALVLMATSERWSDVCAAIDAGARGYIPKSATSAIMVAALRLVVSGGVYVPPLMARGDLPSPRPREGHAPRRGYNLREDRGLTIRQREVLDCLARGQSNKEIAIALGLSQGTVKIHLAAIFRTLRVRNRTQAVIAAGRES